MTNKNVMKVRPRFRARTEKLSPHPDPEVTEDRYLVWIDYYSDKFKRYMNGTMSDFPMQSVPEYVVKELKERLK